MHEILDILRGVRVENVDVEGRGALSKYAGIPGRPSANLSFARLVLGLPLGNARRLALAGYGAVALSLQGKAYF